MKISANKLAIIMAGQLMNALALCEKAGICYASYRRIVNGAVCKPATAGRIARALGVKVTDIIED